MPEISSLPIITHKDFEVTEAYQQGSGQIGDTQVTISTVKFVKVMLNHMRDNCDLMYKALSLPRGKWRPQDYCVPSLLMMTIALQISPTASSDFSNLVGDELQIAQQHNPTNK
jgi:hypothetical protein